MRSVVQFSGRRLDEVAPREDNHQGSRSIEQAVLVLGIPEQRDRGNAGQASDNTGDRIRLNISDRPIARRCLAVISSTAFHENGVFSGKDSDLETGLVNKKFDGIRNFDLNEERLAEGVYLIAHCGQPRSGSRTKR